MAYTVTTSSNSGTLAGTSGADVLGATTGITKDIQVSSKEGNDQLTVDAAATSGSIGMGGGIDQLTYTAIVTKVAATLGDSTDTFTSAVADSNITVGGQGGADTFSITGASQSSRYAGGQGKDTITVNNAGIDSATVVGGSEADSITITDAGDTLFVNGQVGADTITVADLSGTAASTIRGGSENDTIAYNGATSGHLFAGDNGADSVTDAGGENSLEGGGGADTIASNAGADTLTGGAAADTFKFDGVESGTLDANVGGSIVFETIDTAGANTNVFTLEQLGGTVGTELVTDFVSGTDKVQLNLADFTTGDAANAYTAAKLGAAALAETAYFMYGTYNSVTGDFTVTENGPSTLLCTVELTAGGDFTETANYVVFSNTKLATTDFTFA